MIDLEFNRVSKRYVVRSDAVLNTTGANPVLHKLRNLRTRSEEFWAVRDVSFQINRGEALGIIGHNGAGKSTILKLLSSITAPTEGEITINGRLSALIEVGSGFHPELSGRENIFLSGSILGMRRKEIASKLESIVDFAGVRQFIDTPVKRYSSGMYVRLGFALAAHLDPDILLLDEVLAVGDAAFQAKCMQRITELEKSGTTIVFISHDLNAVERLCTRAILMHKGRVASEGATESVIAAYHTAAQDAGASRVVRASSYRSWDDEMTAPGNDVVRIRSASVRASTGQTIDELNIRHPVEIELTYDVYSAGHSLIPYVVFRNRDGVQLFTSQVSDVDSRRQKQAVGRYISAVHIPGNFFAEGRITVEIGISSHLPEYRAHAYEADVLSFQVVDDFDGYSVRGDYRGEYAGVLRPALTWRTALHQSSADAR